VHIHVTVWTAWWWPVLEVKTSCQVINVRKRVSCVCENIAMHLRINSNMDASYKESYCVFSEKFKYRQRRLSSCPVKWRKHTSSNHAVCPTFFHAFCQGLTVCNAGLQFMLGVKMHNAQLERMSEHVRHCRCNVTVVCLLCKCKNELTLWCWTMYDGK